MMLKKVLASLVISGLISVSAMAQEHVVVERAADKDNKKGSEVENKGRDKDVVGKGEHTADLKKAGVKEVNHGANEGNALSLDQLKNALSNGKKTNTSLDASALKNLDAKIEVKKSESGLAKKVKQAVAATALVTGLTVPASLAEAMGTEAAQTMESVTNAHAKSELIEKVQQLSTRSDVAKSDIISLIKSEKTISGSAVLRGDGLVQVNTDCLKNFKAEAIHEAIAELPAEVARGIESGEIKDAEDVARVGGEKLARDVNDGDIEKGTEGFCTLASKACNVANPQIAETKVCKSRLGKI